MEHAVIELTIQLPTERYEQLRELAANAGCSPAELARAYLETWLDTQQREAKPEMALLRAAGLLVEPSPAMLARAAQATLPLEDVRAALDRAGGEPLSEVILAMRGPKD
jgi:hypothetical protein